MIYVGLTDDLITRKQEHGNPSDWWFRLFASEREARIWLKEKITKIGYTGGSHGGGWSYGYMYTITDKTKQ